MDLAKRQLFAKEAPKTEIGAKLADFGVKLARTWRFGKEIQMRKKNFKGCKCIKKTVSKAEGVCRIYDALQLVALDELERDDEIAEIRCNVVLEGSQWDAYTTDFLCKMRDGDLIAFETCFKKLLIRPQTMELLDASRDYWMRRGIEWRLVVDADTATDMQK